MPSRTSKFRGKRTHGRGRKAGRGSGKRGGTGNAGLGSHKKILVIKNPDLFKRRGSIFRKGFRSLQTRGHSINIDEMRMRYPGSSIDLHSLGYEKLLGRGKIDEAMKIRVSKVSKTAQEKILEKNGQIISETEDLET